MAKSAKDNNEKSDNKPIRTSFNILPSTMKKVRYVCLVDDKDLTEVVEEGLQHIIKEFEKRKGAIPI